MVTATFSLVLLGMRCAKSVKLSCLGDVSSLSQNGLSEAFSTVTLVDALPEPAHRPKPMRLSRRISALRLLWVLVFGIVPTLAHGELSSSLRRPVAVTPSVDG